MFRTVLTRTLLVLLVIVLSATRITAAHASTPMTASGTFTYTSSTFTNVRSAGGNTIQDVSATVIYTGTFSGTLTLQGLLIFHPDGTYTATSFRTFTGTVDGVPGTVSLRFSGGGTDTILSATGALAGLHGVLDEVILTIGSNGPTGTYTGRIHYSAP